MKTKNPFEVLGIAPQLVRTLSDEQMSQVIKSQYRTLQQIFHPDKQKGSEEKSKELNQSYEQIGPDSPREVYQAFKTQFVKRAPVSKKSSALEEELLKASERETQFSNSLLNYLASFSGIENAKTVFNAAPCTLNMIDTTLYDRVSWMRMLSKDARRKAFFVFKMQGDGNIEIQRGGTKTIVCERKPIGTIDKYSVRTQHGSMARAIKKIQGVWTPDDENLSRRLALETRQQRKPREIKEHEPKISPVDFHPLMPLLSPLLREDSYLFSFGKEEGRYYFVFEGQINKIQHE